MRASKPFTAGAPGDAPGPQARRAAPAFRSGPTAACPLGRASPPRGDSGQMAVELAVLVPVIVVVAVLAVNLMQFSEACARFDRVSLDAVLSQGVSPEGSPEGLGGVEDVEAAIRESMGEVPCEVEVRVEDARGGVGGAVFDLAAGTARYVCVLRWRPWPSSVAVGGASIEAPAWLSHEASVVVDRYRAGVVT